MADEREKEKWLIFALSDASGICVTMLPHLSSLSDWTACTIKGRERKRCMHTEIKSFRKRGYKKSNRLREKQIVTEENGIIGVSVQMRMWRKSPSFPRCWWMPKSRGRMIVLLKGMWRGWWGVERETEVKMCHRKPCHDKLSNHMSLIERCSWLQPALLPCVLVREESGIEKAGCVDVGNIDGRAGGERAKVRFDTVKSWHKAYTCRSAKEHVVKHRSTRCRAFVLSSLFLPEWIHEGFFPNF